MRSCATQNGKMQIRKFGNNNFWTKQTRSLNINKTPAWVFSVGILHMSSDGRVVRASASVAVDLGLIPNRAKPIILKLVFTASLPNV